MDPGYKIIRGNYRRLTEILSVDVKTVCAYLYEHGIISERKKEDILEQSETTPSDKATALLDLIIKKRGQNAFDALYQACLAAVLHEAADILQPDRAPHQNLAGNERTQAPCMFPGCHSAGGGHRSQMRVCEMSDAGLESDGAEMKENLHAPAMQSLSHSSSPFSHKGAMQVLTAANTVSDCGFEVSDCGTGASDTRLSDDIMRAAKSGDIVRLKSLIQNKGNPKLDVNKQDKFGNTSIMYAVHGAHFECVEILCSHADVSISNKQGFTALMLAAYLGCDQILNIILQRNCNLNASCCDGNTALMYAAFKGHYNCVERLMQSCDVNKSNSKGLTALMHAAREGHRSCVELLIVSADLNKQDNHGCTALMIAVLCDHTEIVKLLVEANAGVNIANNYNYTPLTLAEEKRHNVCAKILRHAARS